MFNMFQTLAQGMTQRERERVIELYENPPTGRTIPDLVQNLYLKREIDELTRLYDAYRERGWRDIDGDGPEQVAEFKRNCLRLHRDIVSYFERLAYGDFVLVRIDQFASIQDRIAQETELSEGRRRIQGMWDFYHTVAPIPDRIRQLPEFNLQRAADYGKALVVRKGDSGGKMSEEAMRSILDGENSDDGEDSDDEDGSDGDDTGYKPGYLHGKWLAAKLFLEQQPAKIQAETEKMDRLEIGLDQATFKERRELSAFKRNQDSAYCTQNYQVSYQQYCIAELKKVMWR